MVVAVTCRAVSVDWLMVPSCKGPPPTHADERHMLMNQPLYGRKLVRAGDVLAEIHRGETAVWLCAKAPGGRDVVMLDPVPSWAVSGDESSSVSFTGQTALVDFSATDGQFAAAANGEATWTFPTNEMITKVVPVEEGDPI